MGQWIGIEEQLLWLQGLQFLAVSVDLSTSSWKIPFKSY